VCLGGTANEGGAFVQVRGRFQRPASSPWRNFTEKWSGGWRCGDGGPWQGACPGSYPISKASCHLYHPALVSWSLISEIHRPWESHDSPSVTLGLSPAPSPASLVCLAAMEPLGPGCLGSTQGDDSPSPLQCGPVLALKSSRLLYSSFLISWERTSSYQVTYASN
jgi:hypothetical protein